MKDYFMTLFVTPTPNPNFAEGREGRVPTAFVIHKPEGTIPSTLEYLADPATQKSYHFMIALTGQVYMLVDPDNTAWHSGVVIAPTWKGILDGINPNLYTIGISLEGFAANPETKDQLCSLARLMSDLALHYQIPLNDNTVVFHREIQTEKTCPGFHMDKFSIVQAAQYIMNATAVTAGNV